MCIIEHKIECVISKSISTPPNACSTPSTQPPLRTMVFIATATITNFINEMIATSAKPTILEFATEVHKRFYPEQDIAFMDYFFELASQENEGKFVVPHQKLIEYGVVTSSRSNDVKERIENLGLQEGLEYLLRDIPQNSKKGGRPAKVYMLTPEAFKMCLIRARRYNGQTIDVTKYADYYLFLEKVVKYYDMYQSILKDLVIGEKDCKIDELLKETKAQSADIKSLNAKNDELLALGRQQMATLDIMNDKLDVMFDFMLSFARMTIPMWLGSSVVKTQFDNLAKNNTPAYALKRLKVMFVVSFVALRTREDYEVVEHKDKEYNVRSTMKTYFCCTNFADVCARIKLLHKRHSPGMIMLRPQVVCLYSGEINTEIANLEGMDIFPDQTFATYARKNKMYDVSLPCSTFKRACVYYDNIVENARGQRFQAYQTRIDDLVKTGECPVSENILEHMTRADEVFFTSALPFCQQFVDSYTTERKSNGWRHISNKNTTVKRSDMKNAHLGDKVYSLRKLRQLIDANTGNKEVDNMVDQGIISKKDISSLKKLAKLENIDTTKIDFPEDLTDSDYDSE